MTCPSQLERARALAVGADAALIAHHAECAACRDEWQRLVRAIELARELPVELPAPATVEQARTAILARADRPAAPARRSRTWIAAGCALAAAAAVLVIARPSPPAAHGAVHGSGMFELASGPPDEIVRLHDGTIDVAVTPLGAGERFRVIVGASEVEVRGTAFTVTAAADRLIAVAVAHGRVEVRPEAGATTILEAGQSWHGETLAREEPAPPPIDAPPPPAPQPPVHRPAHARVIAAAPVQPAAPAPAAVRGAEETAYDAAWDALRAGKFHDAAAAFARTAALAPAGPLAGDARYWRAVALAREPRPSDAIAAFREVVDEDPGNPHRGEASAMLGWLLVDAHQLAEAGERFRAAADDPRADVRASAKSGLAAIAR